ncbi:trans-acting enoyl reductase family protein [Sphingomonas sp. SUN039]|uniref:saccharopine dehydrogenase family protein n=1 Tax=Sphingomonas sp. SUN039 TaxID=2937787 RepID=UPI002164AFF0|nr:saccharopine dehydrogenase NADP-binding domain-containing protein [Sphingomonas sp. SUN039]UVO53864.1 saccharopine dehydrogenase NADP-binding domain-containing protein [Sphingomonas sp. SUN039]
MTKDFDIAVYGATGFTGRLVAEYLIGNARGKRWAMAGRSADKLAEVRDLIGAPADTPLIVADASDDASLAAMCARTEVVLTTVGPYQLYGNELVAACAKAGTGYVDLCGEPAWMRHMIDAHAEMAKASGAKIVFSCGFDSIPFDLGVLYLQDIVTAEAGGPAPRIKGRVRKMQGTFSGGTAASMKATMAAAAKDLSVVGLLKNPFALTPGFEGPSQPMGLIPEYDKATGMWAAPFIMAPINTKNVHRTNALLGHSYGEDFKYDEMLFTTIGDAGKAMAEGIAKMNPMSDSKGPKPGEGPSKEERDNGFYEIVFIAEGPDGKTRKAVVKGDRDPGYGSTSKMIAEAAMLLSETEAAGGFWTPSAIMGRTLIERLVEHAGLTFERED